LFLLVFFDGLLGVPPGDRLLFCLFFPMVKWFVGLYWRYGVFTYLALWRFV
jgi:hypothetical protein